MTDNNAPFLRSPRLLSRELSRLLIVDVQEKLVPHIFNADAMLAGCEMLIRGAGILNVPVFATEQYPKGLGPTVSSLAELLPAPLEKLRFSSAEVLDWGMAAEDPAARDQIVVAGIEAHVCIQQTVLDLISHGYRVHVPADAVGSRREPDYARALQRMADSGATMTTAESVLFEWTEVAGTAEFKAISQIVK